MKSVLSLLNKLHSKGIKLKLDKESNVLIRGNKKQLDQKLLVEIKRLKPCLVEYLSQEPQVEIKPLENRSDQDLPLSYAQQRLWLLNQLNGASTHYNIPTAIRLSGRLDMSALAKTFSAIVERHESLRTCFMVGQAGQPRQQIQAAQQFLIETIDLSALSHEEQQLQLAELTSTELHHVFDLSSDLMLRAKHIKVSADEHVLLVTMHHIASDGWSMSILVNELSILYSAFSQGKVSPLASLEIQYADYAHWQRNWLQGEVLDRQLDYWGTQLAGLPAVHSLPLDYARPVEQSFVGASCNSLIDKATTAKLNSLCQSNGATIFMGLHAAFSVLLSRYSNEEDIVVGTPIANREQAEIANLIGFFVNTLVLRSNLSEEPSFSELLNQSKATLLDAYSHQQVPFEQIVEQLHPDRSLSHSALFQIMLVMQNNEQSALELPGLEISAMSQSTAVAKYDLTLSAAESAEGLHLEWEFNTDLFDPSTITRMASHFSNLFKSLVAFPEQSVFKADLLGSEELQRMLIDWNDTTAEYPSKQCIQSLFEERVKQSPDAIAVMFEDQQLTYQELNQQANQLAHYLVTDKQVMPDTLVGLCVERSLEMVIGLLAILKAGGAYVPLDPEYPKERLQYMLDDAELITVLTQSHVLSATPINEKQALCLDDEELLQQLLNQPHQNPSPLTLGLSSEHLAYVIYTSGSTGKPKASLLNHKGLCNLACVYKRDFVVEPQSRVLQFASLSFDAATWDFCMALPNGATLVVPSNETVKSADALSEMVEKHQVTHAILPPVLLPLLVRSKWRSVKTLTVGGDACSKQLANEWAEERRLINAYGPSEITIFASKGDFVAGQSSLHIGQPIQNTQVYILNKQQPVPIGVAGELFIGGVGLSRGYLNRSDLTNEKFITNPFYDEHNPSSSNRLFKTGDLVRWLPNGNIEFLGRIDHQVKIRGFRIELGEIENALIAIEGINDAVVVVNAQTVDKAIVAYVVLENEEAIALENIHQQLANKLPDYMLPAAFVFLDSLPLSPNGKLDRKALPEPDLTDQQQVYVAPRNEIEKVLCSIWQRVLGLEQVGMNDNFFHLGGHSLLVMEVISLAQDHGLHFSARQVFANPTLAALAAEIQATDSDTFAAPANLIPNQCNAIELEMLPLVSALTQAELDRCLAKIPGGAANVQDVYPLAPLQEGILFHHMMNDEVDPYILPVLFSVNCAKAFDDFVEALQFIIDRHDIMRTAIVWRDQPQALQVVCRNVTLPVRWLMFEEGQDIESEMRARSEAAQALLNLEKAPLLRVDVARESETDRHLVLVRLHHMVADHVVLEVIQREIAAFQAGKAEDLPASMPYREFVAQAQHQAQQHDPKDFFAAMLAGVDEPTAPFELLDINGDGTRLTEISADLAPELSKQIFELAKELKVSPAAIFHAVWAMVVSACSGRDDVVFGTIMSGRLQGTAGAQNMLGVFINTLPLRVQLDKTDALHLIHQVHMALMELLPFEQTSLALAQSCSDISGDAPLFSALINYRHSASIDEEESLNEEDEAVDVLFGQERSSFPFNFTVDNWGDRFSIKVQLDKAISAQRVLGYVETTLEGLVAALRSETDQPVKAITVIPRKERYQLLNAANDTVLEYNDDYCIHELFEAQVIANPNATAVRFEDQRLSYLGLNQKANRLAHYLIHERHIEPDQLVGVCLDRSIDRLVAIVAILKAGGAYVPLDPEYPSAPFQHMLDDAALSTVITQSDLCHTTPIKQTQALCLDDGALERALNAQLKSNPCVRVMPSHLAYVIYTSGSTGLAKGVRVEHKNIVRLVHRSNYIALDVNDRVAQASNSTFDAATFEVWGALSHGAQLVFISKEVVLNPDLLSETLADKEISVLFITTALLNQISVLKPDAFSQLKYLLFGGETVDSASVTRIVNHGKPQHLIHVYGPTENTTFSTYYEIERPLERYPIGKPINGSTCFVLGKYQEVLPAGVAGELYVGGAGVARDYLNQPEITENAFIPDPFNDDSQARLYRTGDMVRYLEDGCLEFVGRVDNQVKIRGFRIEIDVIEDTIRTCENVKQTVVIARTLQANDVKHVIAYVTTNLFDSQQEGESNSNKKQVFIERLREKLKRTLPDYMMPSQFVLLAQLPLTLHGKVDIQALPEPDVSILREPYVSPRTEAQRLMCEIWQDVLGVAQVGIHDNFYALGGDSLVVMSVVVRMREQGISIQAKDIIRAKTISEISELRNHSSEPKASNNMTAAPESFSDAGVISLTPWQNQLLDRYSGTQLNHYNMVHHRRLDFKIEPGFLSQALNYIISKHHALRTRFTNNGSSFSAEIISHLNNTEIGFVELSPSQPIEQDQQATDLLYKSENAFIDIANGPLIRVNLWNLGDQKSSHLRITVNHLVSDAYSLQIIYEDLITAYKQIESGNEFSLPELSACPFVASQKIHAFSQSVKLGKELDYWSSLPLDRIAAITPDFLKQSREQVNSGQCFIWQKYSKENTQSLTTHISKFEAATIADVLTFLAVEAQKNWLGGDYFHVNVLNNGRNILEEEFYVDLSRTVGYYNLTKPLILKNCYERDALDALNKMIGQIKSIPTKGLGVRYLLNTVNSEENDKLKPLMAFLMTPQTMLIQYFGAIEQDSVMGIKAVGGEAVNNIYRISMEAQIRDGALEIRWSYNENVYTEKTIQRLVEYADELMRAIMEQLNRLSAPERLSILGK